MQNKPHSEKDRFKIEVGTSLKIQVGQFEHRMESVLVGIRHDKYLIITMPRGSNHSAARLDEEGAQLVIRYIHKGNAYGFKSPVLDVITSPEKLLVISYPVHMEVYELRSYPRLNCFLPSRIFVNKQVINGSVVDISRTGAHYTCSANEDIDQLAQHIGDDIYLDIQLPGTDGYTHIAGSLRNIHASSDKTEIGIRFDKIDTPELINLLSFLLDAQALPEHQNLSGIIQKHYEWREKVFDFIHAAADIEQDFALSPHECDMGRWLKDKGQTQYGGTDAITELDKVHRDLHHQVEKAVNLRTKGKREESIRFFNKLNIEHISHRIAAVLIAADESKIYSEASSTLSIDEHLPEPSAKSENRSKDSE